MRIRPVTEEEAIAFYGARYLPAWDLWGADQDGVLVGICGLTVEPQYNGTALQDQARVFGFFDLERCPAGFGIRAILAIRDFLKEQDRSIYVQCNDALPTAEKFLTVLGFTPTDEYMRDLRTTSRKLRVWKWQA